MAALVALAMLLPTSGASAAPKSGGTVHGQAADAVASRGRRTPAGTGGTGAAGLPRAPNAPPLVSAGVPQAVGDETGPSPQGEADPLVSNGLGSPLCKGALGAQELSGRTRRDCETSGFAAASSPTGNYGIDVHIDTGFLGLSSGGLLSTVQDLFVTPLWTALVWAVHALVVMLEWCFTIDLLDSASAGVGSGLREMQSNITEPWLASVLAVASVVAVYNGLVRRRVSDALGQTLLAGAMMVGGLW